MVTAGQARTLAATPELLAEATAAYDEGPLRAGERLRARWDPGLAAAALEQVELRRSAAAKLGPAASRLLLTRPGLEQASGAAAATHRAGRIATAAPAGVADLCCGIGGDLIALAAAGVATVAVDRDETHAVLARHNARTVGYDAPVAVADVRDLRVTGARAVFVDPARRSGDDRRGGYSPGLDWCLGLPVPQVCVKAAPGLDLVQVPTGWEVEFVAERRDLKEAVLWSPAWATANRRATVLEPPGTGTGSGTDPGTVAHTLVADPAMPPAAVRAPGPYLLDPSPAVTRAGAVADLAARVDGWQLDPRIAFLGLDHPTRTPFARLLVVEASLPFGVKPLAAELRRLDIGAIDIRRRGLAGDVDVLRRRLRPRGSRRATVVLTRVVDRPWTFVCTEPAGA